MHRHRAGVERGLVAPDPVHELVAGEDLARVAGEEPEEVELLGGELERPPSTAPPTVGVEHHVVDREPRSRGAAVEAGGGPPHARGELRPARTAS